MARIRGDDIGRDTALAARNNPAQSRQILSIGRQVSRQCIWRVRSIAFFILRSYKVAEPVRPPFFDGPAPRRRAVVSNREPIFDPFSVYEKSPDLLAQELTALHARHLRQIIRDFNLVDEGDVRLETLTEPELGSLIMQRVRELHP